MGSFESEKFAVQLARGSLKFGNSGIAQPDSMAQIGIFLSQIGGAGFEGQEASGVDGGGREAVEVSEFAVQFIGGHRGKEEPRARKGARGSSDKE